MLAFYGARTRNLTLNHCNIFHTEDRKIDGQIDPSTILIKAKYQASRDFITIHADLVYCCTTHAKEIFGDFKCFMHHFIQKTPIYKFKNQQNLLLFSVFVFFFSFLI